MLQRLLCWLKGRHEIRASVEYRNQRPCGYVYHCTRCHRQLSGPRR